MQFDLLSEIANVTLDLVKAGHSAGLGTLTAATADTLTWQAPGSETAGPAVAIANGETKILTDGEDATLYIVVKRTSIADLSGSSVVLVITAKSTADRLAEVDAAITECLAAQSAGHGDSNVTRASLATLNEMRNALEAKLLREQNTSARVGRADMRDNF
jgi:hypothetical protein